MQSCNAVAAGGNAIESSGIAAGGCSSGSGGILGGPFPGIGPTIGPYGPSSIGVTPYTQLPACVSDSGHRFAISLHHKDRACCERCGYIRKVGA